jgi:multicomponent K+:H+ antiporter subunit G
MPYWIEVVLSALIVIGSTFVVLGAVGLVRLPDFYMRLHTPTKATTLGMGCILIASMLMTTINHEVLGTHELLITIFLFITAPVSAMMMAKTALHYNVRILKGSRNRRLLDTAKHRAPPPEAKE